MNDKKLKDELTKLDDKIATSLEAQVRQIGSRK